MVGQIPIYYAHKNTGRPASNITLMDDIEIGAKQTSIGFTSYPLEQEMGRYFLLAMDYLIRRSDMAM